ncbi:MAG: hypothetical protein ACQERC_10580 [Bacteroidota bacterium]
MKKIIFYSAAMGVIALSSCKKEYNCECTTTTEEIDYDENDQQLSDLKITKNSTSTTIIDKTDEAVSRCKEKNDITEGEHESNGVVTRWKQSKNCQLNIAE